MPIANTRDSYGSVTKTLHWVTVLLIIVLFPLGLVAHHVAKDARHHKADHVPVRVDGARSEAVVEGRAGRGCAARRHPSGAVRDSSPDGLGQREREPQEICVSGRCLGRAARWDRSVRLHMMYLNTTEQRDPARVWLHG